MKEITAIYASQEISQSYNIASLDKCGRQMWPLEGAAFDVKHKKPNTPKVVDQVINEACNVAGFYLWLLWSY